MLQTAVSFIENNVWLHALLVLADTAFAVASCALLTRLLFGLRCTRRYAYIVVCVLTAGGAALQTAADLRPEAFGDWVLTVSLLLPFVCAAVLFFSRGVWKALLAALCCDAARGGLKYLLLMFFGYDYKAQNPGAELLAGAAVSAFLFAVLALISLLRRADDKKGRTRIDARLYLLIAVTAIVFILSMVLLGLNNTAQRRTEFFITLANIPLFAATIGFSVRAFLKAKLAEENYRNTLSVQLAHFENMERKNDELRMFRHDLPKKLRPLMLCVREGRTEEAEEILRSFNVELEASRPRYATGNISLDTVLECAQQAAEKQQTEIELSSGSVFPAEGIAPVDIYTIFSNALDNALEACAHTEAPRKVTVASRVNAGRVYVRVTNPFAGALRFADGLPRTTKRDSAAHGYGMRSIRKTAEKYGQNNVKCSAENGIFCLQIELTVPRE
jgi:signal transduction histidine kinase